MLDKKKASDAKKRAKAKKEKAKKAQWPSLLQNKNTKKQHFSLSGSFRFSRLYCLSSLQIIEPHSKMASRAPSPLGSA